MNAAAGAAAATVGAQRNGIPVTKLAVQLGALAGVTKSGITLFSELALMAKVNFVFGVLIFLISSSFGVCPLLTTEICNIALGQSTFMFRHGFPLLLLLMGLFHETRGTWVDFAAQRRRSWLSQRLLLLSLSSLKQSEVSFPSLMQTGSQITLDGCGRYSSLPATRLAAMYSPAWHPTRVGCRSAYAAPYQET